jgi:hypothetical protein
MTKAKALKLLNPILAILFLNQALSGIFHDSIPYEIFEKAHGAAGYFLAAVIVVHIFLNWTWIKNTFFRKAKQA